jgi:hypothetical protein
MSKSPLTSLLNIEWFRLHKNECLAQCAIEEAGSCKKEPSLGGAYISFGERWLGNATVEFGRKI